MKVPFFDLQPQCAAIRADLLSAIARGCASQHFIMGYEALALLIFTGLSAVPEMHGVSSIADAL